VSNPDLPNTKLNNARDIYYKQNEYTPSSKRPKAKVQITWREWWEARWKDDYDEYTERMGRKKG